MLLLDAYALQPDLALLLAAAPADFVSLRGEPKQKPDTWVGKLLLPGATACDIDNAGSSTISDWNYECRWKHQTADAAEAAWQALDTAVRLAIDPTWKVDTGSNVPDSTLTAGRISARRDDGVRISAVHYSFRSGREDVVLSVWSPR